MAKLNNMRNDNLWMYFMGYLFTVTNIAKRESTERWFTGKGHKSFNEYVCALIDKDMVRDKAKHV